MKRSAMQNGVGCSLHSGTARYERPSPHPVSHFALAQCEPTLPLQGRVLEAYAFTDGRAPTRLNQATMLAFDWSSGWPTWLPKSSQQ